MRSQRKYGGVNHLVMSLVVALTPTLLAGCANFKTIDRRTLLSHGDAVAIHLDAQQRLVLATANGYCAEPSPDAFSAYVASLGLGASSSDQDATSLALGLQSSSGSIGLRTQSITLMRDALYRMCEAANNGHLNNLEVAAFLRRSQDLTAVVLAIEQLTGAVTASQVILTPASSANASANLVSNQQVLDQAEQNVQTQQEAVTAAETKVTEMKKKRDDSAAAKAGKDTAYQQAQAVENPDANNMAVKRKEAEQARKRTTGGRRQTPRSQRRFERR